MCGITGIVSNTNVLSKTISCLKKLEYRGYDSSGIAFCNNSGNLNNLKSIGKIAKLEGLLQKNQSSTQSNIAIAHTRWATHGKPSCENSHPHGNERVQIVHNGIIENFDELKEEIKSIGYDFKSQTDTEVVAALINFYIEGNLGNLEIVKKLTEKLEGSFAIGIIFANDTDKIYFLKNHSPLVIGLEENENYIASDNHAISSLTQDFIYLKDLEYGFISQNSCRIFDETGEIKPRIIKISLEEEDVSRGGYGSYMLKEIMEQPTVLKRNLDAHFKNSKITLPHCNIDFKDINSVEIIACGTSYYAGLVAKYLFEDIAKIKTTVEIASEVKDKEPCYNEKTLFIFPSQSGETSDTAMALKNINETIDESSTTLALVNRFQSLIAKNCDNIIECHSGIEIGVASTKNFVNQVLSFYILALKAGQDKGLITSNAIKDLLTNKIQKTISDLFGTLSMNHLFAKSEQFAKYTLDAEKIIYTGKGSLYPIALEGALKLKELTYVSVEGFAMGEFKHGPIAIVDNKALIFVLIRDGKDKQKSINAAKEIISRDGKVVIIADFSIPKSLKDDLYDFIEIPKTVCSYSYPIAFTGVVQLISYHSSRLRGYDTDKPRNLAKSVTVE